MGGQETKISRLLNKLEETVNPGPKIIENEFRFASRIKKAKNHRIAN